MDKEILSEVIAAEKDIQQCIEHEQARLRAWLDEVKKEAAEAIARAEQNDGESLQRAIEEATQKAASQAKLAVEAAEARAARFRDLDDAALSRIVLKRLPKILME